MEVYDRVVKVVGPKKAALKTAEAQLQVRAVVCAHVSKPNLFCVFGPDKDGQHTSQQAASL
jgi:hypothetical protein